MTSSQGSGPGLALTVKELTYWVKDGNKGQRSILKGLSGIFAPGKLTAILGPSGSGKTTFMNIAAGYRTKRVSGTILVDGLPRNLSTFRRQCCYITQVDHIAPFLTVQEAMTMAARLKLGPKAKTEGDKTIESIIQQLHLQDCRNTLTNTLSGGESKRLSIALELVNNPPIMFFDEPTSGLDSRNSFQCVKLLQSLAHDGRTIICTVHQPSARIFQMFDQLYAISDGQCIYRGTTDELVPFLDSVGLQCPPYHNPADFLVEVAVGEYGELTKKLAAEMGGKMVSPSLDTSLDVVPDGDLISNWKRRFSKKRFLSINSSIQTELKTTKDAEINSETVKLNLSRTGDCEVVPEHEENLNNRNESTVIIEVYSEKENVVSGPPLGEDFQESCTPSYSSSTWTQFSVLLHRTFLTIYRNLMLTKLRLGAHVVVALMISLLYYQVGGEASKVMDNTGCLFFIILFFIFTAMMPTILTFPLEMNVLCREHLNRWYSLKSYYMAKALADMPFQIAFPLLSVLIVYAFTGQPLELWRGCVFTFFCILTSLVAQSIGLTIGAAFTVQEAVFLGPASIVPMLLFSGFFIQFSTIPVYLRWITYLSFVRYGFEGVLLSVYGFGRPNLDCSEAYCYLKSPTKIMENLGISESSIYMDAAMLTLYFFVVRILGYYILKWKVRKNR